MARIDRGHGAARGAGHLLTDRVVRHVQIQDHAIVRRDQRRHFKLQDGVLELRRRGAARCRFLERNIDTLHDGGLLLVGRNDARGGKGLALAFVLRRGKLQVDEVAAAEQRNADAAVGIRRRGVDLISVVERSCGQRRQGRSRKAAGEDRVRAGAVARDGQETVRAPGQ